MSIIGKVYATAEYPSTPVGFYFWTKESGLLNPFDIVKADNAYAVVESISHTSDAPSLLAEYYSNGMGNPESLSDVERVKMTSVWARLLVRFDNTGGVLNDFSPVAVGTKVETCKDTNEICKALQMPEDGIPVGSISMYNGDKALIVPLRIDKKFLIGPDSAHVNVSGISGLAAKTSYLMFLLNAIRQKDADNDTAFIIFNVKGKDLMNISRKSEMLENEQEERLIRAYRGLGLKTEPICNVTYFVPGGKNYGEAKEYEFTLEECKDELKFFFEDDDSGTMESCCEYVIGKIGDKVSDWDGLLDKDSYVETNDGGKNISGIQDRSWDKFLRVLRTRIKSSAAKDMFVKVLSGYDLSNYIRDEIKGGDTMVVDVAPLDNGNQSFVFGTVLQAAVKLMEEKRRDNNVNPVPSKIIFFFDELNKYVSSDSYFPALKSLLLDITERGRSLGLILFGAEQFLSAIHPRIKGNCATFVYGRTPMSELAASDFSGLPNTYRNMIPGLTPGQMVFCNASLRAPVRIEFPEEVFEREK